MGIPSSWERQEYARNPGVLSKGKHTKISLEGIYPGFQWRDGYEGDQITHREIELCGSEEMARETTINILVLSLFTTPSLDAIFLVPSTSLCMKLA